MDAGSWKPSHSLLLLPLLPLLLQWPASASGGPPGPARGALCGSPLRSASLCAFAGPPLRASRLSLRGAGEGHERPGAQTGGSEASDSSGVHGAVGVRGAGLEEHDDAARDDSQSSGEVGWDAVGAGVTNTRDLLGLAKRRQARFHDPSRPNKKSRRRGDSDPSPEPLDSEDSVKDVGGEESGSHSRPTKRAGSAGNDQVEQDAGNERGGVSGRGDDESTGYVDDTPLERLDVDWDPAQEDPDALLHEAGRRQFTQALLQRLISESSLPLEICPEHDEVPDPTIRYFDRPKVYLKGPSEAGQVLKKCLPRGFSVVALNTSCSVLTRARTPPPLNAPTDEDVEEEAYDEAHMQWQESDGTEGTVLDYSFTAGNLSLQEYREKMEPRLFKLRCRADIDDANAAFELGMRLLSAWGVRKDPANGCRYLMNAASRGHCFAQTELGTCYAQGAGVRQDADTAVKWWKLASAGNRHVPEGVPSAMHNLAVAYSQGSGVKRDYLLACHWHKKAAKLGDRESQYNLAYYYTVGKGVRRHDRKAAYWLLQAAQQGCPDAALELAARYWRAKGVKRDIAKMTQWLRKAARHSEKPRRILEAISSGANVTVVDDLFPSAQSARRGLDKEMIRAHAELQSEIRAQLERARTRAAAVQRKSAREDLVPGARLGRRLEQALGEASAAALRSVTQRTDP